MRKKVINITHTDLDGVVSAIMFKHAFPYCETRSVNYSSIASTIEEIKSNNDMPEVTLVFTDLAPADCIELLDGVDYWIFDHHETSRHLHDGVHCFVDIMKCGAKVVQEQLSALFRVAYTDELKMLADLANDHDMWYHKIDGSLELNTLYYLIGFDCFLSEFADGYHEFSPEHRELVDKHNAAFREYLGSREITELPCNGRYLAATKYISEICLELDKTATWYIIERTSDDGTHLSVRARTDRLHLGNILKELGVGGGHSQAAGSFVPPEGSVSSVVDMITARICEVLDG